MIYFLSTVFDSKVFFTGHKKSRREPDPAGFVINWPPGSGFERNLYSTVPVRIHNTTRYRTRRDKLPSISHTGKVTCKKHKPIEGVTF